MNSRLKKFLGGVIIGSTLFCVVPKADPLPISEEISQDESSEGIFETIYSKIADGTTSIDVSNNDELGIRANIGVDEPPKNTVKNSSEKNVDDSNHENHVNNSKSDIGTSIANFAKGLVGKPYSYGSTGPNSFDCSGFVVYVYKNFGISLPRTSQAQAYVGQKISKSELKPGDLVFSNTYSSLSHVGVYIGDGKFVHAANSGTGVTISGVNDSYYGPRYAWAVRVY